MDRTICNNGLGSNVVYIEIMSNKKIHIRDIDLSDINFVSMHVTTSADNCKGIKENGLHG